MTGISGKPAVDSRFIIGACTVFPRFIIGTRSALRHGCLVVDRRFLSLQTPLIPRMAGNKIRRWQSVHYRFTSGLSTVREALLVSGCLLVEYKTRTYHGLVGSGCTAGRRGGAEQDATPTKQFAEETSVPHNPQRIEDTSAERLPRSKKLRNPTVCKPKEEQNPRLTSGSQPVQPRFITWTRSALRSWLPNSELTTFCPCKPVLYQECPGTSSPTHFCLSKLFSSHWCPEI